MPEEIPALPLLIKMMGMTDSDNDNQALVALRKANKVLKDSGWTWSDLLLSKVKIIGDPFAGLHKPKVDQPPPMRAPQPSAPAWRPAPGAAFGARSQAAPQPKPQVWFCSDGCGRSVTRPGITCVQCTTAHAQRQAAARKAQASYAAKSAQTAKARRKNPVTLDDIL